jgi:mannan endo-1,4-beta-mannosidase
MITVTVKRNMTVMKHNPIITLLLVLAVASGCRDIGPSFVSVNGREFIRNGKPYYFMGANYWQGMNLAAAKAGGDTGRLRRELDQMQNMGISNLRILALSEGPDGSMLRILPAVQDQPAILKEELLAGLDLLLDEMARRDMTAVLVLNNFWPWSGGMAQYRLWNGADSIPYPPPHGKGTWDSYQKYTAGFYSDTTSIRQHHDAIRSLTTRRNTINGRIYANDPTIMSWQLCNEPRGIDNTDRMHAWIDSTAALIKRLAPKQLVSTGAEGYTSAPEYTGTDFIRMHDGPHIDYATAHVWIQNWGWYDPQMHDSTYPAARQHMLDYVRRHARDAAKLDKPWVLEEFGIMKDNGAFDPDALNTHRNAYYAEVFGAILQEARNSAANGVNFWAYGGQGRPRNPGEMWAKGDPLTGDPPHEPQGWYSVYDTDTSTHTVIRSYAQQLKTLCNKPPQPR